MFVHPSAEQVFLYLFRGALFRAISSSSVGNGVRFFFASLFPFTTFTVAFLVAAADVARVEDVARRRDVFFFFASFSATAAAAAANG